MSGYPPIPRDPSGAPLPVVWDDGLQSWKVYEGLMPLETKLAAIESKLLALDSKFADGSAKVALSGNMVVEHLDDEHQWTDSRVFGLNVRMGSQNGFQPFPNRGSGRYTIIYTNKASVQNSICLNFYKEATIAAPDNPSQVIANTPNVWVASGETLTWNSKSPEMEALVSGGFPYFGVRLGGGGANSKQDVIIAGGGHA